METIADRLDVSERAAALLVVLLVVQIALQIVALIDLSRRPAGTPPPGKWLWLVVVLFANLIGAVVYLAVARRAVPPTAAETSPPPEIGQDKARATVDALYGRDTQT